MNAKLNPQFKEKMNVYLTESTLDYWFNQMYYGTHGPFKRAEAGQAITFENDKVSVWKMLTYLTLFYLVMFL